MRFGPALRLAVLPLAIGFALPAQAASFCPPPKHHRHRHHAAARYVPPEVVYASRPAMNYEDNNRYDGADLPRPGQRRLAYGQPPSWLDGYGTRPVTYGAYGTYNVYGGSAQVMPYGLPPAGGLAVYTPGAYGPGPSIVEVPAPY